MQKEIEKQKIKLHASVKEELLDAIQKDVTIFVKKELKDNIA